MEETDRSCDARLSAKSLQSCPTLCDPIDGSPPGSHPWDSPGKNTGVGCRCLLQCMKVKSESEVIQPCPTPSDPMDCSPPGSSVHGIFQARVMEWGAIAFSTIPLQEASIRSLVRELKSRKSHSQKNKSRFNRPSFCLSDFFFILL